MATSIPSRPLNDDDTPPSYQIVEALAAARDCDPIELESLYGTLDLESLDQLVEESDGAICVEITVDGDRVVVDADGAVRVR